MLLHILQVDQNASFVIYFQLKKNEKGCILREVFAFHGKFRYLFRPKRKRPKPEKVLHFGQKHFALYMVPQGLMGDVVLLPHVSTQFKGQTPDQRTCFSMYYGQLLVSSFPSPRPLFCRATRSQQMMDACGIKFKILTRSHDRVSHSLFGVFNGKC